MTWRRVLKKDFWSKGESSHFENSPSFHTSWARSDVFRINKKKLWCCVGGGNKVIWLYQLSWKCKLATVTRCKADVLSVSPLSVPHWSYWQGDSKLSTAEACVKWHVQLHTDKLPILQEQRTGMAEFSTPQLIAEWLLCQNESLT